MTLTQKLKAFDFLCAFEDELYFQTIGENTTLFIEAVHDLKHGRMYLFYKQNHGRYPKVEFYGRNLREAQLMARLEKNDRNKQKRLLKELKERGRGFPVKSRKELLGELLTKKRVDKMG